MDLAAANLRDFRVPIGVAAAAACVALAAVLVAVYATGQNRFLRQSLAERARVHTAVNELATEIRLDTAVRLDDIEHGLALDLKSGSFHHVLTVGTLCVYGGRFASAVASLERARTIKPDHPEPYKLLAAIHKMRGEHEKSVENLRALLKWQPADQDTWNFLGWSYYRTGDDGNARAAFEQALRIHPDNPDAMFNLAQLEDRQGRTARARDLLNAAEQRLERHVAEHPGFAMAYFQLAKIHAYRRDFDTAIKYLQRAIVLDSEWAFWAKYEVYFEEVFTAYPDYAGTVTEAADIYAGARVKRMLASLARG
jgi:Flp pilus assembly protein TadD